MIDATPVPETLAARAAALFERYRAGDEERMADLVELLTPILWHTARAPRGDAPRAAAGTGPKQTSSQVRRA